MKTLSRFPLDGFLVMLIATLLLATFIPVRGSAVPWLDRASMVAITFLFFIHGAKLSREAILAGAGAWRLHLRVLAVTFALFPLAGLALSRSLGPLLDPVVGTGILFLCVLPSTVQSSIAITAMARGNVPAAVCSASLSNLVGILVTPALAVLLIRTVSSGDSIFLSALERIATTLLIPFILGHLARPLIGTFIDRHRDLVMRTDRIAILLAVYAAFSAAVVERLWQRLSAGDLFTILLLDAILLVCALTAARLLARFASMAAEDEATLVFCGSQKSLASGVPMAAALFPAAQVGLLILPLMIFHQLQLIVCAAMAQRYARRSPDSPAIAEEPLHAL
jgi:sodium/bile acid cotransporter 7